MARTQDGIQPPDVNDGPRLMIITGAVLLFAWGIYLLRMYTRSRPVIRLGWDDWTMTFAMCLLTAQWATLLTSVTYGVGRHTIYLNNHQRVESIKWIFVTGMTFTWAGPMIRVSVACMLFRLKRTPPWRIFLFTMITINLLNAVHATLFQSLQCHPVQAFWMPSLLTTLPGAHCLSLRASHVSLYINSAISITSDLVLAACPLTFIIRMRLRPREKLVLGGVMGLGVFAACASIYKMTVVPYYGQTGDIHWDSEEISLWSLLEGVVGAVAACIPCLKSPFDRVLGKLGLLSIVDEGKESSGAGTANNRFWVPYVPRSRRESVLSDMPEFKKWDIPVRSERWGSESSEWSSLSRKKSGIERGDILETKGIKVEIEDRQEVETRTSSDQLTRPAPTHWI